MSYICTYSCILTFEKLVGRECRVAAGQLISDQSLASLLWDLKSTKFPKICPYMIHFIDLLRS